MLDVMGQDYVRTARAKGLNNRTVIVRHAFRNALIPLATLMAFDFAAHLLRRDRHRDGVRLERHGQVVHHLADQYRSQSGDGVLPGVGHRDRVCATCWRTSRTPTSTHAFDWGHDGSGFRQRPWRREPAPGVPATELDMGSFVGVDNELAEAGLGPRRPAAGRQDRSPHRRATLLPAQGGQGRAHRAGLHHRAGVHLDRIRSDPGVVEVQLHGLRTDADRRRRSDALAVSTGLGRSSVRAEQRGSRLFRADHARTAAVADHRVHRRDPEHRDRHDHRRGLRLLPGPRPNRS